MSYAMSWSVLVISIVFGVAGASFLKLSSGFTRLWPMVWMFASYGLGMWFFSLALRTIEIGVAYAVWAGLGTILVAIIGIVFFKEQITTVKIIAVALIISGAAMLNLAGAAK